jgi:tRNA threonylcarbamoyladenosine biosynthesis protein TsaE
MTPQAISYTLQNIEQVAAQIWKIGKDYSVWSFVGDMGAGKTTLIATICKVIGVTDAVSSPTYAIVNEYSFVKDEHKKSIVHTDWYRLKDVEEAREAGMEEILYQTNSYVFVEWASQAPELLDKPYLKIEIAVLSETERVAKVSV